VVVVVVVVIVVVVLGVVVVVVVVIVVVLILVEVETQYEGSTTAYGVMRISHKNVITSFTLFFYSGRRYFFVVLISISTIQPECTPMRVAFITDHCVPCTLLMA
jgi:hypothetical protein